MNGARTQDSSQPLARKAASLIGKETNKNRTSNVEEMYSVCFKKRFRELTSPNEGVTKVRSDSTLRLRLINTITYLFTQDWVLSEHYS